MEGVPGLEEQFSSRYQILRQIGKGAAAEVYEAFDTQIQRPVALKVLSIADSLTGAERRQAIERFYREVRLAGRLSHPNIAQVYSTGEQGGKHFIVMELCQGVSLREILYIEGWISEARVRRIAIQILEALKTAHSAGIIHRDIKPENIIVGQNDQVKLTDFGIAKAVSDATLTQSGMILGTPAYMSPEQIVGKNVDARSDIFSVGVLLYECLSGRKPFDGENITEVTQKIVFADPAPLTKVISPWPEIVMKALSKSPSDRYQNAAEMLSDIQAGRVPNQLSQSIQPGQRAVSQTVHAPAPPQAPNTGVGRGPFISTPNSPPAQNIPSNLIWSILVTIFCFWPLGIVAIIKAAEADNKKSIGDYNGALQAYRESRTWMWLAAGAGFVVWCLILPGYFLSLFLSPF